MNVCLVATVYQVTPMLAYPKDGTMLRADELTVVHHDDTVSRFTDVRYTLNRHELRVLTASGDERAFAVHDVLTTHARLAHDRLAA